MHYYSKNNRVNFSYQCIEGWSSILLNILLFILKIIVGFIVNSLSLIADAFHSLSDVGTSVLVLISSKVSSKPADSKHPFGHERVEYVSTFAMAIILIVVGIEFLREGIPRIYRSISIKFSIPLVLFVLLTIILKFGLGIFSHRLSKKGNSDLLMTESMHHYSDAISSIFVLVAILSSKLGLNFLDGVFASLIGLVLAYSGYRFILNSINQLIGVAPDLTFIQWLKGFTNRSEGIYGIHDVMIHSYGSKKFISFHIEVDKKLTQDEAHDIVENLREKIQQYVDANITIHVDPIDIDNPLVGKVKKILDGFIKSTGDIEEYHDLRVIEKDDHKVIIFDIIPVKDKGKSPKGISVKLERLISSNIKGYDIRINIDPLYYY